MSSSNNQPAVPNTTAAAATHQEPQHTTARPEPAERDNGPKTLSPKKLAANRANAQKSTGPKTLEGKSKVSKNATTHGLYCRDLLLPTESPALFHSFRRASLLRLNPQDVLELHFADRVVSLAWRLRRLQETDRHLHLAQAQAIAPEFDEFEDDDRDDRHARSTTRNSRPAAAKPSNPHPDPHAQPAPDAPADPADALSPGLVLAASLRHAVHTQLRKAPATEFERLLAIEQRLANMTTKALRELRTLQAQRRKDDQTEDPAAATPPCPFLDLEQPDPDVDLDPDPDPDDDKAEHEEHDDPDQPADFGISNPKSEPAPSPDRAPIRIPQSPTGNPLPAPTPPPICKNKPTRPITGTAKLQSACDTARPKLPDYF
jgi:hypothetical protein